VEKIPLGVADERILSLEAKEEGCIVGRLDVFGGHDLAREKPCLSRVGRESHSTQTATSEDLSAKSPDVTADFSERKGASLTQVERDVTLGIVDACPIHDDAALMSRMAIIIPAKTGLVITGGSVRQTIGRETRALRRLIAIVVIPVTRLFAFRHVPTFVVLKNKPWKLWIIKFIIDLLSAI